MDLGDLSSIFSGALQQSLGFALAPAPLLLAIIALLLALTAAALRRAGRWKRRWREAKDDADAFRAKYDAEVKWRAASEKAPRLK